MDLNEKMQQKLFLNSFSEMKDNMIKEIMCSIITYLH